MDTFGIWFGSWACFRDSLSSEAQQVSHVNPIFIGSSSSSGSSESLVSNLLYVILVNSYILFVWPKMLDFSLLQIS
jgi:hypothetical protein